VLLALVALVAAQSSVQEEIESQASYTNWLQQHGKSYDAARFQIYKSNLQYVQAHNKLGRSYTVGMNKFADMTNEEFKSMHKGCYQAVNKTGAQATADVGTASVPASVDWRTSNVVTPVKDQGQCGSCWTFGTTGSMEGAWAISTGDLVSFSEQQLVDCDTKGDDQGCSGGLPTNAFEYIIKVGGLETESDYPYNAVAGSCVFSKSKIAGKITSYKAVTPTEAALKIAAAQQPIAVGIDASHQSFQLYTGGVYDEPACTTNLDHAVLVVGYGTDDSGKDFWTVKNSWGSSWGSEGYIQMSRNKDNQCGIASDPAYPIV